MTRTRSRNVITEAGRSERCCFVAATSALSSVWGSPRSRLLPRQRRPCSPPSALPWTRIERSRCRVRFPPSHRAYGSFPMSSKKSCASGSQRQGIGIKGEVTLWDGAASDGMNKLEGCVRPRGDVGPDRGLVCSARFSRLHRKPAVPPSVQQSSGSALLSAPKRSFLGAMESPLRPNAMTQGHDDPVEVERDQIGVVEK